MARETRVENIKAGQYDEFQLRLFTYWTCPVCGTIFPAINKRTWKLVIRHAETIHHSNINEWINGLSKHAINTNTHYVSSYKARWDAQYGKMQQDRERNEKK